MNGIATVAELSTWANMRLTSSGCPVDDILKEITEGETMKLLLQSERQIHSFCSGEFRIRVCCRTYWISTKKARLPDRVRIDVVRFKQRPHVQTFCVPGETFCVSANNETVTLTD